MKNKHFKLALINLFLVTVTLSACKKDTYIAPTEDSYDVANRVFRVDIPAAGVPFNVEVKDIGPDTTTDVVEGQQPSGARFNYGFTPVIGHQVSVKIVSDNVLDCYAFYKGKHTWQIKLTKGNNGKYYGEFVYTVID